MILKRMFCWKRSDSSSSEEVERPKPGKCQNAAEAKVLHLTSEGWIYNLIPRTCDNGLLAGQLFLERDMDHTKWLCLVTNSTESISASNAPPFPSQKHAVPYDLMIHFTTLTSAIIKRHAKLGCPSSSRGHRLPKTIGGMSKCFVMLLVEPHAKRIGKQVLGNAGKSVRDEINGKNVKESKSQLQSADWER